MAQVVESVEDECVFEPIGAGGPISPCHRACQDGPNVTYATFIDDRLLFNEAGQPMPLEARLDDGSTEYDAVQAESRIFMQELADSVSAKTMCNDRQMRILVLSGDQGEL